MSQPIECGKCGSFITEKGMTDCGVVKCEECGHEQEYHGVGCEGDHQVGKIPGDKPSGTAEKVADRLSGDLHPKHEEVKATSELPILRITNDSVDRLNFDELLSENLDYPEFAESVGNRLIKEGVYDDSDPGSFTFVVYTTDKPNALREQMKRRGDFVEVYY